MSDRTLNLIFYSGHKIIFLFGFIYTGHLQGKFLALRMIYDQWQVAHKCSGVAGASFLQSDSATIMLMELNAPTIAECYKTPPLCMDRIRSSAKTICQGIAYTA